MSDGSGFYQTTNKDPELAGQPYNRYTNTYITDNALQSVYGRINWNGWDQILVTATFRADASSVFP